MDWFEAITGFPEADYETTRSRLSVRDGRLVSDGSDRRCAIGAFSLPSLSELRASGPDIAKGAPITVSNVVGGSRDLHQHPAYRGALFQVASQFNMLEMVDPSVTPEDGVAGYQYDRTQGPACAMAAGAATIYRNYLLPFGTQSGQTARRQINGLHDIAEALASTLAMEASELLPVRNGYALPSEQNLQRINALLNRMSGPEHDVLAGKLRIGVHVDAEVTDLHSTPPALVSQAFCSAMPVAYFGLPSGSWEPLAQLVLDAAYEATLWQGAINARLGRSNTVLLTRLGGGAFGNKDAWIDAAMERALMKFAMSGLNIVIVSYGSIPSSMTELAETFSPQNTRRR